MNLIASKTRQLIAFFAVAYLLAWGAWIPVFLNPNNFPRQIVFIGLFAPAISAIIVAALVGGRAGVWNVLKRYFIWRFPVKWYLLAFLLMPLIFIISALTAAGSQLQELWTGSSWLFVLASFIFLMVINSGEEIGWRGFALPRLQAVFGNSLSASIPLGIIWGIWHLPEYLIPGQSSFPFPVFLLFTTGVAIIYTLIFNGSSGSLLAVLIFHAGTDIMPRIMNIAGFTAPTWLWVTGLTWVAAIWLYWFTRHAPLITDQVGEREVEPNSV